MAKDFAIKFYRTAWKRCREGYAKKVGYLCEDCLSKGIYKPGEIVHHKIELTPENINNPAITLSWDNLKMVCRDCHAAYHEKNGDKKRFKFDENGEIIFLK